MGQAKKQMMDYEENLSILDNLITLLSNDNLDDLYDNQIIRDIFDIREMINSLDLRLISSINFVRKLFSEDFHEIYTRLFELLDSANLDTDINERFKSEFNRLIRIIGFEIRQIKSTIQDYFSNRQNIFNSEKYYHEQIKEPLLSGKL